MTAATGSGATPVKTGQLNYSTNYVWNSADLLGKGATASVYLGRSRGSGKVVAIKVFERESRHIAQARHRELELLRSVNHKNVIRLHACENELSSGSQMLVMAYCQGGSVYSMLDQSQYGFGFPEDEFLVFLKHIASGLKYLRSKGIIHRDIKPGNILKMIEEDGRTQFVLTDFGAARQLEEEETFMSVFGTEEYLHPDMYQRAVLHQAGGERFFNSSIDLWSLGVTLYHVITGKLPFQPFGGRGNAQTMFQITSSKDTGIISGVQKEANGPIEWSRELPVTCLLSSCLKKKVEPMLANLFQAKNTDQATSFDTFFNAVDDIVDMMKLSVFNCQEGCELTVYVRKNERYAHLQEEIALLTQIPAERQLLLTSSHGLDETVDLQADIQHYPVSVLNNTVYLYEKKNYEIHKIQDPALPPFPPFHEDSTISLDHRVSKECAAVSCYIVHVLTDTLTNQNLSQEAVINLRQYVYRNILPVKLCLPETNKLLTEQKKRLQTLKISQKHMDGMINIVAVLEPAFRRIIHGKLGALRGFCSQESSLAAVIEKSDTRLEEIKVYMRVLLEKLGEQGNANPFQGLPCQQSQQCSSKIDSLHQNIASVATTFGKHKRYGDLHDHERFIHKVERAKLEEHCVKELSVYQGHCHHNLNRVHTAAQRQTCLLLKHLTRADKVENNLKLVIDCQTQISDRIDKMDTGYRHATSKLQEILPEMLSTCQSRKCNDWTESATNKTRKECSSCDTGYGASRTESNMSRTESNMLNEVVAGISSLHAETSEVDNILKSNTESLKALKRILQEDTGTGALAARSVNVVS